MLCGGRADSRLLRLGLLRLAVVPDGAFGILFDPSGLPWLATCERTYPLAGIQQLVKIPCGRWRCARTRFERGGYETFEVLGVPGHSRLLFHRGNMETDSEGCILIGLSFGLLSGRWAVLDSRDGFASFMRQLSDEEEFVLDVRHDSGVDARHA